MNNYSEKFEKMRIAGNLAARTLDMLTENVKEGVSTDYIDKLFEIISFALIIIPIFKFFGIFNVSKKNGVV